jgi:hypothetical protein
VPVRPGAAARRLSGRDRLGSGEERGVLQGRIVQDEHGAGVGARPRLVDAIRFTQAALQLVAHRWRPAQPAHGEARASRQGVNQPDARPLGRRRIRRLGTGVAWRHVRRVRLPLG